MTDKQNDRRKKPSSYALYGGLEGRWFRTDFPTNQVFRIISPIDFDGECEVEYYTSKNSNSGELLNGEVRTTLLEYTVEATEGDVEKVKKGQVLEGLEKFKGGKPYNPVEYSILID